MADFFDTTENDDLNLLHSTVRDHDELDNVVDQVEWEIINHYSQRPQDRGRIRSGNENLGTVNTIEVMLIDYDGTDSPDGLKDALKRTIADVAEGILLNYDNERGVQSKRQGQRAISYRGANLDSRTWPSGWSYRLKNYDDREAVYAI